MLYLFDQPLDCLFIRPQSIVRLGETRRRRDREERNILDMESREAVELLELPPFYWRNLVVAG